MDFYFDASVGRTNLAPAKEKLDKSPCHVEITKKAQSLLKRMDVPVNELQKRMLGHLTRSELKELSRLLEKARTSRLGIGEKMSATKRQAPTTER